MEDVASAYSLNTDVEALVWEERVCNLTSEAGMVVPAAALVLPALGFAFGPESATEFFKENVPAVCVSVLAIAGTARWWLQDKYEKACAAYQVMAEDIAARHQITLNDLSAAIEDYKCNDGTTVEEITEALDSYELASLTPR